MANNNFEAKAVAFPKTTLWRSMDFFQWKSEDKISNYAFSFCVFHAAVASPKYKKRVESSSA